MTMSPHISLEATVCVSQSLISGWLCCTLTDCEVKGQEWTRHVTVLSCIMAILDVFSLGIN